MTNRKQLHNWMKENHFLQSDYQKIRDLYLKTFQQVLPFRISIGNGANGKMYGHFRYELERLGFTNNGDPCGAMGNVGQCSGCGSEYLKKDKDDVTFAKCAFNNDGNLVVDKISIRQSLEVPELDIDQFETSGFSFMLQNLPSEDLLNLFLGASNEKPKEKYIPKDGDVVVSGWGDKENGAEWIAVVKGEFADERYDCHCLYILKSNTCQDHYFIYNDYSNSHKYTRPATEQEVQLLLSELQKAGKIWNADKKQIEDDTRIDVMAINLAKCIEEKDFTPYFPTKELQDMAKRIYSIKSYKCKISDLPKDKYKKNYYNCNGVSCRNCPFNSDNKALMLSMKPFAKELTDKEKFDKWKEEQENLPNVVSNNPASQLHYKIYAIRELFLCANYLNGENIDKGYCIYYVDDKAVLSPCVMSSSFNHAIQFKTKELALKAIDILGEDLIKSAFSSDF